MVDASCVHSCHFQVRVCRLVISAGCKVCTLQQRGKVILLGAVQPAPCSQHALVHSVLLQYLICHICKARFPQSLRLRQRRHLVAQLGAFQVVVVLPQGKSVFPVLLPVSLVSVVPFHHRAAHVLDHVPQVTHKVVVLLPRLLGAPVPVVPPRRCIGHAAVVFAPRQLVLPQKVRKLRALARQLLLPLAQRVRPCLLVNVRSLSGLARRCLLRRALRPVRTVPAAKAVCHLFRRACSRARIAEQPAQSAPVGPVRAVKAKARIVRGVHAGKRVLDARIVFVVVGSRHGCFCLRLLILLFVQPFDRSHFDLLSLDKAPPGGFPPYRKNGRIIAAKLRTLPRMFSPFCVFCCSSL